MHGHRNWSCYVNNTYSYISHHYAFNGMEKDDEIKGTGNQYDYGFRGYDPRLGRFFSVDPLAKAFPYYSPYQFAGNNPIAFLDLDGLEKIYFMTDKVVKGAYNKLTNVPTGKNIVDRFQNIDPAKGRINKGYDAFITYQPTMQSQRQGGSLSISKEDVKFIVNSTNDKGGALYKLYVAEYGEEFVNSPGLKECAEKDKGAIIISVTNSDEVDAANAMGEEFMHATYQAHENPVSTAGQHESWTGWNIVAQVQPPPKNPSPAYSLYRETWFKYVNPSSIPFYYESPPVKAAPFEEKEVPKYEGSEKHYSNEDFNLHHE